MGRIFITGSTDGLGFLAGKALLGKGHRVVLHARNDRRAEVVKKSLPDAEAVVTGDLSSIEETKILAEGVNRVGEYDSVIHNAGVYRASGKEIFIVNTLAPYLLTCLIKKPKRLIYLSSGMHRYGKPVLKDITSGKGDVSYSDSKFHVVLLTKAVARRWPDVYANAVNPGWVPTRMGGAGAPDDLEKGFETQVWLAVSSDEAAKVSGRYFYHKSEADYHHDADNTALQDEFLAACERITGVRLSEGILS